MLCHKGIFLGTTLDMDNFFYPYKLAVMNDVYVVDCTNLRVAHNEYHGMGSVCFSSHMVVLRSGRQNLPGLLQPCQLLAPHEQPQSLVYPIGEIRRLLC